jgi:metallo-beta-lactamase class B
MKLLFSSMIAVVAAIGIAIAQTPASTVDTYLSTAKTAAGTDWAGTFLRLCIAPAAASAGGRGLAGRAGGRGAGRGTPARETWYAEPAKVGDNFYFLGTKIHSAWALAGSEGIILIEALFDYAAKDEILDGLRKVGLDPGKVKYVILSHAHGDHDGGAKLLQDAIPGVHLIYGAEDWDSIGKLENRAGHGGR